MKALTVESLPGVLCLTLCPRCTAATMAPAMPMAAAARLVAQHCEHLGVDAEQLGRAVAAARRPA